MVPPGDPTSPARIPLVFYRTASGNEPVRDWLLGLSSQNCSEIGQDLMRVQWRWPIGMPLVRPMGGGLYEVRSSLSDGTISRVLFCLHGGELYALHGFIKKSQRTPKADLDLALKRKKDVEMADNTHRGSTLDSFLEDRGVLEVFQARAIKEVIAWQLAEAMKEQHISKRGLATMMHTSRTQVDRMLDPNDGNVTIETLQRAAAVVGRRVQLALV